jgi:hypothetical protein
MTLLEFFRNLFSRAVKYAKKTRLQPLACSNPNCHTDSECRLTRPLPARHSHQVQNFLNTFPVSNPPHREARGNILLEKFA